MEPRIIHLLLDTVGGKSEATGVISNPKFILLFTIIALPGLDKFEVDTDVLDINVVKLPPPGGA